MWGKKPPEPARSTARAAQVKRLKDAAAANDRAHREGDGPAVRKTAAIYQRAVANSSPAELAQLAASLDQQ